MAKYLTEEPGNESKQEKAESEEYYTDYDSHQTVINLMIAAQQADHDNREKAREAHLFVDKRDGQWEPYWWNNNAGKPRYTFDMVNPIVDQVTAEIEQSDFDVKVSPQSGPASKETAMVMDGLIRNIESMSRAKEIYINAGRGMATSGYDGWMVSHKYADEESFDQDLIVEPVPNFIDRVWFDPASYRQDKSDAQYAFLLHPVSKAEYVSRWPEGSQASVSDDREGDAYYDKAEVIVVGQLFYVKRKPMELVLMSNGAVYEATKDFEKVVDELAAAGLTEVRRRTAYKNVVCSHFYDATDWLEDDEETIFDRVPVIPVYGNFKVTENKTIYWGVVEKLLDPQRVLNYSMSREIEEGALAPRAKYWMTLTQGAGHEDTLATLNTNSDPVQFYNTDPEIPGAPQQQGGAMVNPGLRTISESMRQLIGQTAGMFAANMGDNPGLQSGVAIERLQSKGDNGTVKYFRALETAIAATGDLLVKTIPKVYDTRRTVRLLYEDNTAEMVTLNDTVIDTQTGEPVTLNDLTKGQYSITCRAGPSFRNKQQETIETIIEIAKVDPSIITMSGDILLNAIPTAAAMQIGERKRMQMLAQGLIPESQMTDEEKAQMQQKMQTQGEQPDPNMVLAMAEQKKAEAEIMNAQKNQMKLELEAANLQLEIRKFESTAAVSTAEAQAAITKSATEQQLTQAKIKTEDAKVALEAEKLRLEAESLRLEQQRLVLDTEIASAEFRIKEQAEMIKLQQLQSGKMESPRRARYNKRTGSIEELS
jgi:hypothetical protein